MNKSLTSNHLSLIGESSNLVRAFLILSCVVSIHLAYGTKVILLRCPIVHEIMHGRISEVYFQRGKLEKSLFDLYCFSVIQNPKENKIRNDCSLD